MNKITKNKLIEVESICKAVFENSMDAILITKPDGRILAANPAACEMFGMSHEEITLLGRNGLVDTTDENLPYLLAERERNGKAIGELRQIRKDGSIFPTEVSSRIFKSTDGDEFTIMIIRDITKKKRSINEIKRARDFAENLIETANVIFVHLDNSGKILKVNSTFENISGYKREDLLEKNWFKVLVPKNRYPEVLEEFSRLINIPTTSGTYGNPILTKNGEERQIQWSHSTLINEGNALGTISFGIDVTEQKKTEQALSESKLWLNRIFDSIDYALIVVTPERTIVKVNEATKRIFGYSKDELINQSTEILHVDYNHYLEFGKLIREAFDKGESANFEFKAKRKNDEVFSTEHLVSLLKDDKQNEIGIVSFVRDLSEKKGLEEKLFEKENLLQVIMQNAPITLFATDINGIFTLSEGKQLEKVNLKPGENVGLSAYDLFGLLPFKDVSGSVLPGKEILTRALNGNVVTAVNQLKDVYFENHIGPIIDKNGDITGAVGVAIDITERKRIEDSLWLSQENLDLALKSAEMGVWHYDISQNKRILNGHTCRLLDIDETTFKGTENEFYKVVHPKDRAKIKRALKKSISTNVPYSVEYRVMRKDGKVSYISARGKLISGPEGKAKEILGIVWDSTERKLFEEKLKKSEAGLRQYSEEIKASYQHINAMIEKERNQIARDLHDDLGQKLAVLNLNISWIKSRMGVQSRSVNNKLMEMAKLISDAAESINNTSYRLRPAILEELGVRAAIEWQLSDISKSTGISYSISFVPDNISIDPDISLTVFRIVQESLTNVVRHSKATNVSVYFSSSKNDLRILIRDNGIGISQDKVIESKSFGIIGMRERVSYYGGEFVIKGRPDKGTVIRIKIPLNHKKSSEL